MNAEPPKVKLVRKRDVIVIEVRAIVNNKKDREQLYEALGDAMDECFEQKLSMVRAAECSFRFFTEDIT